jgi:hypothetical protein
MGQVRVVVTRIERDGTVHRRMVDTAQPTNPAIGKTSTPAPGHPPALPPHYGHRCLPPPCGRPHHPGPPPSRTRLAIPRTSARRVRSVGQADDPLCHSFSGLLVLVQPPVLQQRQRQLRQQLKVASARQLSPPGSRSPACIWSASRPTPCAKPGAAPRWWGSPPRPQPAPVRPPAVTPAMPAGRPAHHCAGCRCQEPQAPREPGAAALHPGHPFPSFRADPVAAGAGGNGVPVSSAVTFWSALSVRLTSTGLTRGCRFRQFGGNRDVLDQIPTPPGALPPL